jgi:RimJ/RimL family protein N-acetyltransferase
MNHHLSVRELQPEDINLISDYWLNSEPGFLQGLCVDLSKLPTRAQWIEMLTDQLNTPLDQKKSYCLIWQLDNSPVGHCNINKIIVGEEAYMHLHLWESNMRNKGYGKEWVKKSVPVFFEKYRLKTLYSEPYALNPAPNKTLEKAGFTFVREYVTIPGAINFEQPVKLWRISL